MDVADAVPIWDALVAGGDDYGITPCGILAMDMARVEAGLFMLDVDYTSAHHAWIPGQKSSPFEMGLGWTVALDKPGYFVGRRALEREHREGSTYRFVGIEVEWESLERAYAAVGLPPQIPAAAVRGSLPIYKAGQQVGYASTSTWSPVLKKYIALAHVQQPHFETGTAVTMEITVEHRRRQANARVVPLPFYEPEWKKK
jgi:aminomethyltransferase